MLAHLQKGSLKVKKGDKVLRGQQIANKNNSGTSSGDHIHFEVRINGSKVDPLLYTYADSDQVISINTDKNYKILRYEFKNEPVILQSFKVRVDKDKAMVRTEPNSNSKSYKQPSGFDYLRKGATFNAIEVVKGEMVKSTYGDIDDWYKSEFGRYVWSGGLSRI